MKNFDTQMMDFKHIIYVVPCIVGRLDVDDVIGWIAYVAQLGNIGALVHRTTKLVHIGRHLWLYTERLSAHFEPFPPFSVLHL